ncbi:hypothetical protein QA640_36980 [Bradyrhizobium sp. CB82]|uniref:hypothetical protein n=1 Tax=Bradyrhizobium sp. CB82 TaxID=3039159 RepID=UPI0024B2383F|nr:hypothetical protein [Bradyrhizobium sp. CB82]WFU39873.1 hypothetical protein QA640_36980 [Bradyrhizobium sp. CB82]
MTRTRVTEDLFRVEENEVIHAPTNARWTAYPGRPVPANYSAGMLGSVLPNGDEYWREDVEPIALKFLAERPMASEQP